MKRRGFTLIELMVVIAIIIILAAIAIPNYLSMTARAKRSRVASDFAAIATALETYRTDWNQYPPATAAVQIAGTGIVFTSGPAQELTGTGTPGVNKGTTAAGETAPIQYMTSNILTSMVNPYSTTSTDQYKYIAGASAALGSGNTTPQHWMLSAVTVAGGSGSVFLSRTDEATAVSGPSTIGTLPTD